MPAQWNGWLSRSARNVIDTQIRMWIKNNIVQPVISAENVLIIPGLVFLIIMDEI